MTRERERRIKTQSAWNIHIVDRGIIHTQIKMINTNGEIECIWKNAKKRDESYTHSGV